MAKMSKLAKDIKNQPKLKKELAIYIAKNTKVPDIMDLLINGHRGFLAMSEKELTNMFDEMYDQLVKQLKEAEKAKTEEMKQSYGWGYQYSDEALATIKKKIKEADKLYDKLFEQVFL